MAILDVTCGQFSRWLRMAVLVSAALGLASVGTVAYNISGSVTKCDGTGLANVKVTASRTGETKSAVTDANGAYTITGLTYNNSRTYTVAPSLAGYSFTPPSRTNIRGGSSGVNFQAVSSQSYNISGTVTCGGEGLPGVTVRANSYTGSPTDANGNYTITVPASCAPYTVTPSMSGLTFTPANQSVMVTSANVTGINFAAQAPNVSISGQVADCYGTGIPGVTVTAHDPIGGTTITATTDSGGYYTLAVGSQCDSVTFTVTPALAGYSFTPTSKSVTISTTNVTGVNFQGLPGSLSISGRVMKCDGSGLQGVTISLTPNAGNAPVITDASGSYVITGISGTCTSANYTVTPSMAGYTFAPVNQPVVITGYSLQNINFKEAPPSGGLSISGTITACGSGLANVSVSTDSGALTTTDSSGNYTLSGLTGCTTYVVIPSKTGYAFTPGNLPVSLVRTNVTGVDFAATGDATGAWDPLRQVTLQILRPNLLIVQDVSGSMVWDINAQDVGVDSQGTTPTAAWSAKYLDAYGDWQTCNSCSTKATQWQYTLTINQTFPSRIATVKNALGSSVGVTTPWQPPGSWSTDTLYTYITNTTWTGNTIAAIPVVDSATRHTYAWTVTFGSAQASPGIPFTAYDTSGHPTVGSGGVYVPPQDIVGKTANRVNWGIETFSTDGISLRAPIDTGDTGVVTTIESLLKLQSAGGLNVGGGTPTRDALTTAQTYLSSTYTADQKKICGRSFGAVLVTDGLSNTGNPNDGDWISPCGGCPGIACCDASSSGYNCPDNYAAFPAGVSETLWNMTAPANVRTWAIGISKQVNPCEMNMDAYMGRTDASSPNGDTGFNTASDPYLPQSTGDTVHYQPNVGAHKDYAFFATSATALAYAFSSIVASVGAGDFSTTAPVVSTAITGGSDIAYLASAESPAWRGHFYAYDVHLPATPVLNWDAGKMLAPPWIDSHGVTRGRNLTTNPRVIYTWDSSNTLVNLGAYSHTSALPSSLALPAGFDDQVLDYLKGFDGNRSNTQRPWILGPILNSTAAVFSAPEVWKPSTLPDHKTFETTYAQRHPLVMVGTSDGMLHVFDVADGYEVYAILPPDQLANQPKLYNSYMASFGSRVTGEPVDPSAHVYGVASSPRFADVYMSSDGQYHTVLLLTEGRGGSTMAALDITHSYPGRTGVVLPDASVHTYPVDPNCLTNGSPNYTSLISVIWSKDSSSLPGLAQTWSVPAVGATSPSNFDCVSGSGYQGCSTYTPKLFSLNMRDGSIRASGSLSNGTSPLVQNQAYGAGVLYNATTQNSKNYYVQNLGVVSDTNGRVWFVAPSSGSVVKAMDVGANQPIYFTPAVGYAASNGKDVYAFASGNLYETSSAITGTASTFVPKLYIVVKSADASPAQTTDIYSVALNTIPVDTSGTLLHAGSQVTADPVLFLPASAGNPVKAFFLVYDPKAGTCVGNSFLIELDLPIDLGTGWNNNVTKSVQSLGSGVASGFAFSGGKIIVARSAIGGGQVTPQVAGQGPSPLGEAPALSSWIELK